MVWDRQNWIQHVGWIAIHGVKPDNYTLWDNFLFFLACLWNMIGFAAFGDFCVPCPRVVLARYLAVSKLSVIANCQLQIDRLESKFLTDLFTDVVNYYWLLNVYFSELLLACN